MSSNSTSNSNTNTNSKPVKKVLINIKQVIDQEPAAISSPSSTSTDPSNNIIQVRVKLFGKINSIKKKVRKQTGIPIAKQVLILSGKQLDNNERLSQFLEHKKEVSELTLFLVVKKNDKERTIPPVSDHLAGIVPQRNNATAAPVAMPTSLLQSLPLSTSMVVVKITFEDQKRRVPFLAPHTMEHLTSLCTSFFGVKNAKRMIFHYLDEEADPIQFSTDLELTYALKYYSIESSDDPSSCLFKIRFSLKKPLVISRNLEKPEQEQEQEEEIKELDSIKEETPVLSKETARDVESTNSPPPSPSPMRRRLQAGDVIQLVSQGLNVVLAKKTPVDSDQSEGSNSDDSSSSKSKKKNKASKKEKEELAVFGSSASSDEACSQWIVEKVTSAAAASSSSSSSSTDKVEEEEIIFLKNKSRAHLKSHLRASESGDKLSHNGGVGFWAKFVVHYEPSPTGSADHHHDDGLLLLKLRNLGRSSQQLKSKKAHAHTAAANTSFIGLIPEATGKTGAVRADLNKEDKHTLFNVRFI